jgi:hypothetical protein
MNTPYPDKFQKELWIINQILIDKGYVVLSDIPDVATVEVVIDECNDIIYDEYIIEEVTEDNQYEFPDATIGKYVLSWKKYSCSSSSSSSSSSSDLSYELKRLLESNLEHYLQVRYISSN